MLAFQVKSLGYKSLRDRGGLFPELEGEKSQGSWGQRTITGSVYIACLPLDQSPGLGIQVL